MSQEAVEVKLKNIREHPELHRHADMNGVHSCAFIGGAISMRIVEAHEGLHGSNGGRGCDVSSGPCSCGAWH